MPYSPESSTKTQLTLFTTCKPFIGETAAMQMNALTSWQLSGLPTLIIGNDYGSQTAAKTVGATHLPDVAVTQSGIPLLSSLFELAKQHTDTPYLAYINSDIVLLDDLKKTLDSLNQQRPQDASFLLTAKRINIPLATLLVGKQPDWRQKIQQIREQSGSWDAANAIDLFVFNRDLFDNIPDFAIGRMHWDNWLLWKARQQGAMIIDASLDLSLLHPIHGYTNNAEGWQDTTQGHDATINRTLANGHMLDLEKGCSHLLKDGKLVKPGDKEKLELSLHCRANPAKEFIAYLIQLTDSQPLPAEKTCDALDVFRTLLARNQRYLPQQKTEPIDTETFMELLKKARNSLFNGDEVETMDLIQNVLAANLLRTLKQQTAIVRPIVIWGTGELAKRLFFFLQRNAIEVTGFADNDSDKSGKKFLALPVFGNSVEQMKTTLDQSPFIVIGSMFINEIEQGLVKQQLMPDQDYCY